MLVNVEMSPMAASNLEAGRLGARGIEITRILERLLKESRCIDTESLCLKSGQKVRQFHKICSFNVMVFNEKHWVLLELLQVWQIRVDVHILDDDGGLLDCACLSAITALAHPGPSTWLGMNLARIATAAMPPEELARLHRQGELSETAGVPPFSPLERYGEAFFASPRYPDVAALANRTKSTGSVNYNHEAYIEISGAYADDSLWIISHRPSIYLHGVAKAWYNYFKPQTEISHVSVNSDRLRGYVAACARVLYGRLPFTFDYGGEAKPIYLFSTVGIPLLILFALVRIRRQRADPASRLVLAFMALTVIYVALVGNAFEVWENQRFRFYTDPFLAVLFAMAADRAARRWRGIAKGSSGPLA